MKHAGSRHGGIISGLLFAATFAFLALLVAGVVVTKSVHVRTSDGSSGTDLSIDTPEGRLNIRSRDQMDPSLVGVPIYPGAYRSRGAGGANIEWTSDDGASDKNLYVMGGEFRTRDSVADVVDFYQRQLPNLLIISDENKSTRLEYRHDGIKRIISIGAENGETRIGVASVGGRESN